MTHDADEHGALGPITEILQERAFQAHRRRAAEYTRLSDEIAEIDRIRHEARSLAHAVDAQRLLGADTLWQDWILQRRADLLGQSAMARAHQVETLARARSAFARHQAVAELAEAERKARGAFRERATQAELQDLTILKALWQDGREPC